MHLVDEMVEVTDDEVVATIRVLLERAKLLVEGAGAAALAALLFQKFSFRQATVVALLSGGRHPS